MCVCCSSRQTRYRILVPQGMETIFLLWVWWHRLEGILVSHAFALGLAVQPCFSSPDRSSSLVSLTLTHTLSLPFADQNLRQSRNPFRRAKMLDLHGTTYWTREQVHPVEYRLLSLHLSFLPMRHRMLQRCCSGQ